jgi:hypothetical protein
MSVLPGMLAMVKESNVLSFSVWLLSFGKPGANSKTVLERLLGRKISQEESSKGHVHHIYFDFVLPSYMSTLLLY